MADKPSNPPERIAALTLALIPCIILLGVAIANIYRQHIFSNAQIQNFKNIRYAVVVCCFQQLLVFIGYLSENIICTQLAWNTWIPTALFCLTFISIRLCESYISIRCIAFTINKKHIYIAYTSWCTASILNWSGSISGWAAGAKLPQAFFYATWKLIAAICLCVVSWIVWQVRQATVNVYQHQLRRESLNVRFKPKPSNLKDDIVDGVQTLKLTAQNSFDKSIEKLSKKHHKQQSSESMSIELGHINGKNGHFAIPTVNTPTLNDVVDDDNDQDDVEMAITTPRRVPEAQLCRQFTLDKDGNVIDKISIDNMTLTEKQLFKLSHSLQRMRNLLLCLALLILVLISDSINQYIYFGKLASNPSSINAYAHPSIAQVVVLYLSIWSFVQCILLIYTWIPSKRFRLELKRRKSK
eukprot:120983_1